ARPPQPQHLPEMRVAERELASDLVVRLVEGAAGDEDADHDGLAGARSLLGRIALKTSPPTTAATAPITLCQRKATFVLLAAHATEPMPVSKPAKAPFDVARGKP